MFLTSPSHSLTGFERLVSTGSSNESGRGLVKPYKPVYKDQHIASSNVAWRPERGGGV